MEMKNSISKESFVNAINEMISVRKKIETIENVLIENCDDAVYCPPSLESAMLCLLEDAFNDKGEWISYFLYELDGGKDWVENSVSDNNGNIRLSNAEELYQLLIDEPVYVEKKSV